MDFARKYWPVLVLANVYAVGVAGFLVPGLQEKWAAMTPLNLLLSFVLLMAFHRPWNQAAAASVVLIGLLGFLLEVAGVQTGLLFGEYAYGPNLGWKVAHTPLLIGINWIMLVYMSVYAARRRASHPVVVAGLAAALMTGIDVLIEPFAMRFGLWDWQAGVVPLQNYMMWFVASFIFALVFGRMNRELHNIVALPLLVLMILFFFLVDMLA